MIALEHRAICSQGSFLCAEAHPDLGGSLLVLAVSESLLTWDDYCKALPSAASSDDDQDAATTDYCVHPAVHAATLKVHPHSLRTTILIIQLCTNT